MPSVFTMIINRDIPGHFVWEDDECIAILSINPTQTGHALVIPRAEIDHWLDVPPELAAHLMVVAQEVGTAQVAAFGAPRVGLVIAGHEVPHTHLHVIPMFDIGDLSFANARASVPPEELAQAAERLRVHLPAIG
ncbi:HIT family protein [Candidatus Poriferisocius sp.]|uniref:HIT family protein n=1 Tax=Candidatus Poriferisocius sp. TaxID=3101276 RepID=UPI003B51592E